MTDPTTVAGWLLILGPVLGVIPVANPALVRIWTMPRLDHLATVGAHRRGWALLNIGFGFATMVTTAGLFVMADALGMTGSAGWHSWESRSPMPSAVGCGVPYWRSERGPPRPSRTSWPPAPRPNPARRSLGRRQGVCSVGSCS